MRALPDILRVSAAEVTAFKAELALWVLTATLPLIQLALWTAVAEEGPVAGFDQGDLARYFVATLLVRQLTASWLVWSLNFEIRSGTLSQRLLKPVHPLWQYGVQMVLAMPIRMAVLLPVIVPILWWKPELWRTPAPLELLAFVVSVSLAWLLTFLVQAIIAIAAFWIDKTDAFMNLWFAVWMVASGYSAPMAMLPPEVDAVLRWLPFRATLGAPVEILAGSRFTAEEAGYDESARHAGIAFDLGLQAAWTAILLAVVAWAWRRGVARYGAFGA